MTDRHGELRANLAAYLAGVLAPEDERRLEAHAAQCAACGASLTAARAALPGWLAGAAHVPASALVAYAERPHELLPAEHELVRDHVEQCESCRADFAAIADGESLALPAAPAAPLPGPRTRVRDWGMGLAAGAVAASVVLAFLRPTAPLPPVPPARPQPPAPSVASPRPALLEVPPAIVLRDVERGTPAPEVAGVAAASGRIVLVELPAQMLERGEAAAVGLEVVRGSGERVFATREGPEAYARRRRVLLDAGSGRWTPGDYVLRLRIEPGPRALVREPEVREYRFRIGAPR